MPSLAMVLERWLSILADATVRGAALIAVTAAIAWLLRRRSAAARSVLWTASGCAILVLPLLTEVLPRWHVTAPPLLGSTRSAIASRLGDWKSLRGGATPALSPRPTVATDDRVAPIPSHVASGEPPNVDAASPWLVVLFAVWGVGAVTAFCQILLSLYRLARMERRARVVPPAVIVYRAGPLLHSASIPARTRVLEGPGHIEPMTWGICRPRVLVPAGWERWPSSMTAAVLAHELAHVRRHDVARQLPWDIARLLYWFNPLIAIAARQAHLAREQACDDEVVGRGVSPTSYADALVALARVLRSMGAVGAPAFGGRSDTELAKRVAALVEPNRVRSASRRASVAVAAFLGVFAVISASVSFAAETDQPGAGDDRSKSSGGCCDSELGTTVSGKVGRALDSAFASLDVGGLSGTVLVATDGGVVFAKGYGFADRSRRIPAAVNTRYRVAGMTKAFTAAAVADFIDRGLVSADAPIARYLPEVRRDVGGITVHQLLTHTDGLGQVSAVSPAAGSAAFLGSLGTSPPEFAPGTSYGSNDAGHSVLAALVERITARPFEVYVRDRFLRVAGMRHSRVGVEMPDEPIAIGYVGDGVGAPVRPEANAWGVRGSRGLVTTVDDLRRWHVALTGGRLVRQGALDLMFTPYLRTAKPFEQGYGWLLYDSLTAPPFRGGPIPVRRRSGREPGFETELVHDPNDGWLAIVLLNRDDGRRLDVIRSIRAVMNAHPPPLR